MIFWICIAITLIAAIPVWIRGGEEGFEGFLAICIFGSVATFLLVCMMGSVIFENSHDIQSKHTYRIVSLQDNEGTEGHIGGGFFFVTGNIGTYQFYSWYEREPDGSYESRQISTHDYPVKIWEEPSSSQPKAIKRETCHEHSAPSWLSPFDFSKENYCDTDGWELFVPKGTIVRNYRLDGAG